MDEAILESLEQLIQVCEGIKEEVEQINSNVGYIMVEDGDAETHRLLLQVIRALNR